MAAQQVPAGVRPLLLYNILLYMRSVVCREYDCTTVLQRVFTTVECNGSLVVPDDSWLSFRRQIDWRATDPFG